MRAHIYARVADKLFDGLGVGYCCWGQTRVEVTFTTLKVTFSDVKVTFRTLEVSFRKLEVPFRTCRVSPMKIWGNPLWRYKGNCLSLQRETIKKVKLMKKILVISACSLLLMTSCGTYTATGAYTGGSFGSIIGAAIGGIAGGPRGSDIGSLIGMASGAAVGAAIGSAADQAEQRKYEEYKAARQQRTVEQRQPRTYQDDVDTNGADDRLYGFDENFNAVPKSHANEAPADIVIRNPRLVDASRDGELSRGEEARMVFEVFNNSSKPAFGVLPTVTEVTGNRHIRVSENVLVECIQPGKGIRYTAVIRTDDRLKDGEAVFRIGVMQRNKDIPSQSREFRIRTNKR